MQVRRYVEGAQVCVPASIANLGPGLDTLAVAVQLYLRVRIGKLYPSRRNELQFDFIDQRLEGENAIERAFRYLARDTDFPALRLEVRSEIPMRAGLGSSAAATVAGLRLFQLLAGARPAQELLQAASALEGHPDNAAAALLGGLAMSCQLQDGSVMAVSSPWPDDVGFAVLTPEGPLETCVSRNALPSHIARPEAIFNLQRLALLVYALQNGDYTLLREALRDRWHQPFRQQLVPGLKEALSLTHPDLLGVCLSGSGPSIVGLARRNLQGIGSLLSELYENLGLGHRVRLVHAHQPANTGVHTLMGAEPIAPVRHPL